MGKQIKLVEKTKGHISKAQKIERENMRNELFEYPTICEEPPSFLVGEGLKEWQRIIPLLNENIPISELDSTLIASYCLSVGTVVECQKDINDRGVIVEGSSNPSVRMQSQAIKDMRLLASSLGISLDSRMKIAFNKTKEKPVDPFEKLMAND